MRESISTSTSPTAASWNLVRWICISTPRAQNIAFDYINWKTWDYGNHRLIGLAWIRTKSSEILLCWVSKYRSFGNCCSLEADWHQHDMAPATAITKMITKCLIFRCGIRFPEIDLSGRESDTPSLGRSRSGYSSGRSFFLYSKIRGFNTLTHEMIISPLEDLPYLLFSARFTFTFGFSVAQN